MDSSSSSSPSPSEVTSNGQQETSQQQRQLSESPMIQEQTTVTTTTTTTNNGTVLTPEQEEEMKLRMKYPNPQKPGGSTFIQKMLHKGCKKYFDSGDYNMAKSRTKATHGVAAGGPLASSGVNSTAAAPNSNSSGQFVPQQKISEESINTPNTSASSSAYSSPVVSNGSGQQQPPASANQSQGGRLSTSPQMPSSVGVTTALLRNSNLDGVSSVTTTPSMPSTTVINTSNSASAYNNGHHTPSLHSRLSATNINTVVSGNMINSPLVLFPSSSSSMSSSSSTSTSSLHHHHQPTRQLLSSSTSASNINAAAAIDPVLLNAADEIGHGIPTPECLPQSRKHTISQSKLVATPRLSSS